MADKTAIEWTEATWNPITGCSIATTGCAHCYAMKLAGTRLRNHPSRAGLTVDSKNGPVWTGEVRFNEGWLTQPLQWKRPRMIFVCAHGDLFHESVPDVWIDKVFAVMALAPQHTFQVLTKRAARMRQYLTHLDEEPVGDTVRRIVKAWPCNWRVPKEIVFPLPNVWLGVSAERQQEADERIPHLLATPAAVRWLSAEPLLGPIDLDEVIPHPTAYNAVHGMTRLLDWIVVGGESGDGARPMHPDWARSLRDQCADAGVLFFFKQWGNWAPSTEEAAVRNPRSGWTIARAHPRVARAEELYPASGAAFVENMPKAKAGRLLDGVEHNDMPERSPA